MQISHNDTDSEEETKSIINAHLLQEAASVVLGLDGLVLGSLGGVGRGLTSLVGLLRREAADVVGLVLGSLTHVLGSVLGLPCLLSAHVLGVLSGTSS